MELETYLRFLLVLVFVLGLIGLFGWLAKRFGLGGRLVPTGNAGRERRLGIVEVQPLDGRRKLVLVKRDGLEHLIILGQSTETVVETRIGGAGSFAEQLGREARQS
jgi:flagellar protein FliO/FliZ